MFETLFSERGLSLDRLKVLIEVRDAGSIAQAAPSDPVRQSQYSRQLRELSEFFGCEVTQRRGKVLKLTSQGERLAELAREHLRALDDFRAECRQESIAFTVGAGDSLVQWLIIPRLGQILEQFPDAHFTTSNLRTNEIVQHLADGRLDFGVIRKNAIPAGLKAVSLGNVSYIAMVPTGLIGRSKKVTLREALERLPLATQTTDGQFASGLRDVAHTLGVTLSPALSCQSFPQTVAALKSGRFWAIVPALARPDIPTKGVQPIDDPLLETLDQEAMLAWNPRMARIRPHATRIASKLQHELALSGKT